MFNGNEQKWRRVKGLGSGAHLFLLLTIIFVSGAPGISARAPQAAQIGPRKIPPIVARELLITVRDENGVVVPSAEVTLTETRTQRVVRGETDFAGRWTAKDLPAEVYEIRVEKEGFFAVTERNVRVQENSSLDVTLNHQREYVESVHVVYSPPAIDRTRTVSTERLTSAEITNLPYPVTRDIRYTLPLLPGVLQDGTGQLHVEGSETRQIEDRLDGFNVTGPASGLFGLRVSVDAIRAATVESSRIPAEYGKGSGGLLSLTTGMGDDHLRFAATDFLPALQSGRGLHVSDWNPRGTISGPILKGKAWFLIAPEGEYNQHIFTELPPGADSSSAWRFGNLAKVLVNLRSNNILTATYLLNRYAAYNYGLDLFNPLETTIQLGNQADFFSVKDQSYRSNGALVEVGFAATRFHGLERPRGDQTYIITPDGTRGNFYAASEDHSKRFEGIADAFLPPIRGLGRHEIKFGVDLDQTSFNENNARRSFEILREDGTLARRVTFAGNSFFSRANFAASGYAQDQWLVTDRLTIAGGFRLDWDEIVRRTLLSPRLAASFVLTQDGQTKLVAGVGRYYDTSNLEFLSRAKDGERFDTLYDRTGQSPLGPPAETSFEVGPGSVRAPRFLNWSAGFERRLPASIYLCAELLEKRGHHGWTYLNPTAGGRSLGGIYKFATTRRDRFDSEKVSLRKGFSKGYVLFASYEHSRARSNQVLNFSLDNPVFGPQTAGPLPWDSPNRFLSWGFLPLPRGFDLGYSLDVHTGFPFALVNQDQQLVAPPGARRFPTYFALNMTVERRIHFLGFEWALRTGFNDITNRHNATAVDNNVNSPHFLELGGLTGRALVARLRLLGRK